LKLSRCGCFSFGIFCGDDLKLFCPTQPMRYPRLFFEGLKRFCCVVVERLEVLLIVELLGDGRDDDEGKNTNDYKKRRKNCNDRFESRESFILKPFYNGI